MKDSTHHSPALRRYLPYLVTAVVSVAIGITIRSAESQDLSKIGGDLTSTNLTAVALQLPAPNVVGDELVTKHVDGHTEFHRDFSLPLDNGRVAVGPLFNHVSCGKCHVNDGRGPIKFSNRRSGSPMLIKVSLKGLKADNSPRDVPKIGEQLQDHSVKTGALYSIRYGFKMAKGSYPDGTAYTLRIPNLRFDAPLRYKRKIVTSVRMTPSIQGMGLLEAVPDATIEALADPDDLDGDGISGRVSRVPNRTTGQFSIGRFGFRASHPTVRQQSAAAFFHDMGITNELFPGPKGQQEIPKETLDKVEFYQQAATIPTARNQNDPRVLRGKELFIQVRCSSCHVMTLQTGDSGVEQVRNQTFHPFTDLLLHDMGPGLADNRPEFGTSGSEWRTTPLWGIGLVNVLTETGTGFLHDGRARTPEEAILWHDGEAAGSREAFKALSADDRQALLEFLNSL